MAKSNGNGCGAKHIKLACWIIGLVLTVAVGITLAGRTGLDARLRKQEQANAASLERDKGMQRTLDRILQHLDKGDGP